MSVRSVCDVCFIYVVYVVIRELSSAHTRGIVWDAVFTNPTLVVYVTTTPGEPLATVVAEGGGGGDEGGGCPRLRANHLRSSGFAMSSEV